MKIRQVLVLLIVCVSCKGNEIPAENNNPKIKLVTNLELSEIEFNCVLELNDVNTEAGKEFVDLAKIAQTLVSHGISSKDAQYLTLLGIEGIQGNCVSKKLRQRLK